MADQVTAKVGDRIILELYVSNMPLDTKVIRTTKTTIYVEGYEHALRFERDVYRHKVGDWKYDNAYPYSQGKWDELVENALVSKQRQEEKEEQKKQHKKEVEQRIQQELEEVKEACHGILPNSLAAIPKLQPDGSRMYYLVLPIKPCYAESKKNFEILIVRCNENIDMWKGIENDKIEGHYTYCNGNTHSFASCSGIYGSTDEDILWECCRQVYHSGW